VLLCVNIKNNDEKPKDFTLFIKSLLGKYDPVFRKSQSMNE